MRADWQTTINILAVMMTMNSAAMKLKKMGVESLLCLAGVTIIKSQTALGEDYLRSDIFDSFNYVGGVSVLTIKCCLPICAATRQTFRRGTHHSKSDRQPDGACDLQTQVPAGPFRIQDLGDSVSGRCIFALKNRTARCRNMTSAPLDAIPHSSRSGSL